MKCVATFSLFSIFMAGAAYAQPTSVTLDQWYKAKYGRPTPATEEKQKAEAASTAYREDTSSKVTATSWFEQWFKAKFGRLAPSEQARRDEEASSTAYREVPVSPQQQDRTKDLMKGKLGRTDN